MASRVLRQALRPSIVGLCVALGVGCASSAAPNVTVGPTIQAIATSAVPTAQALQTQSAPTVQAIGTQTAPTSVAAATAAAPTIQALATSGAPTVQALATAAAPAAATLAASAPVRLTGARIATDDASVVLQNMSDQTLDISGWSLQVGTARAQLPSGVNVQPNGSVTVHTAAGTNTASDVYLGQAAQALATQLRPGVTVVLNNASGSGVSSFVVPNA